MDFFIPNPEFFCAKKYSTSGCHGSNSFNHLASIVDKEYQNCLCVKNSDFYKTVMKGGYFKRRFRQEPCFRFVAKKTTR